jgi:predicted house-cleaning NTP pyrophosphatase (Maf/HAM1 superfamily)
LLSEAGFEFESVTPRVAEKFDVDLTLCELTMWNAIRKGMSVAQAHPDTIVLAADTLVALDHEISVNRRILSRLRRSCGD